MNTQYRANAAECQVIANYWPDLIKREYEGLERQWLALAEQTEKNQSANNSGHQLS